MSKHIAFWLAVIVACSSASAADSSIGFKQVPLGASVEEYKVAFPDHHCDGSECNYYEYSCGKLGADALTACMQRNTYAGQLTDRVQAFFKQGRLARVVVRFSSQAFDGVEAAAKERYGKPTEVQIEDVQNGMGAKFKNPIETWVTRDTRLLLIKYLSDGTHGLAEISTEAEHRASLEDAKRGPKAAAKDM